MNKYLIGPLRPTYSLEMHAAPPALVPGLGRSLSGCRRGLSGRGCGLALQVSQALRGQRALLLADHGVQVAAPPPAGDHQRAGVGQASRQATGRRVA